MSTDLSPALREAVEVMARALCKCEGVDPDVIRGWIDGGMEQEVKGWKQWEPDATAALRALVEAGWSVAPPEPFKDWGMVG